jgi:peptide/nickel transport system ATP-binding protein
MYLGHVVESGPTEEFFAAPNHPYAKALLDEIPRLDQRKRIFHPIKGEIPSPLDPPPSCHFHPRCPNAFERCRVVVVPKLKETAPGRRSACHLNDES